MNISGKQAGIGAAVLLVLSTAAGAVSNLETLGIVPATRDYVMRIAENLSAKDKESQRRWIDLYQEQLFETELKQQQAIEAHGQSSSTAEIYESRKRTLRNQIKLLEKAE